MEVSVTLGWSVPGWSLGGLWVVSAEPVHGWSPHFPPSKPAACHLPPHLSELLFQSHTSTNVMCKLGNV